MKRNSLARSTRRSALLFLVPGAVFLTAIFAYPTLRTIVMAFSSVTSENIVAGSWPFVGLDNFVKVFQLQATVQTAKNTILFLVGSIIPQVIIGLFLAVGLRKFTRLRRVGRALILLPWLFPSVAVATVFTFIFATDGGLANWVLTSLGIVKDPVLWLASPGKALAVIILVNIWIGIPFNFLIIQSGLQALPHDVHEAAAVDGAGRWRELIHITVPMLRESLFAVIMLGIIGTLKVFDFVWVMTAGGPSNGTMLPGPLAYQEAFVNFNYGAGSAVIILTVLLMVILSVIYVRVTVPRESRRRTAPRPPRHLVPQAQAPTADSPVPAKSRTTLNGGQR